MISDLIHRQKIYISAMCAAALAAFLMLFMFKEIPKPAAAALIVIMILLIFAVMEKSVYVFRLKRFADELPEEPEHFFRKSSYRVGDRFYWFSDHFLDLRRLRRIPYEKISSITVSQNTFGIGSLRIGPYRKVLIPLSGYYSLYVRSGFRIIRIRLSDSERKCRTAVKNFTKHNPEIKVYNLP